MNKFDDEYIDKFQKEEIVRELKAKLMILKMFSIMEVICNIALGYLILTGK